MGMIDMNVTSGYVVVYLHGVSSLTYRPVYQKRLLSGGSPLAIRSMTILDVKLENYALAVSSDLRHRYREK